MLLFKKGLSLSWLLFSTYLCSKRLNLLSSPLLAWCLVKLLLWLMRTKGPTLLVGRNPRLIVHLQQRTNLWSTPKTNLSPQIGGKPSLALAPTQLEIQQQIHGGALNFQEASLMSPKSEYSPDMVAPVVVIAQPMTISEGLRSTLTISSVQLFLSILRTMVAGPNLLVMRGPPSDPPSSFNKSLTKVSCFAQLR